ncbi:MAG: hypothetical protein P1U71_17910, partial [Sneathiella sp.]
LLIVGEPRDKPAMATEIFRHPALKVMFADHLQISIPSNFWVCGTPVIADAIAELHAVRSTLTRPRKATQE